MLKTFINKLLLKDLDRVRPFGGDSGPTSINSDRMALDERIEWRTSMTYSVVRDTMSALGVNPRLFRLKVVPFDSRAHAFYVMMDIGIYFSIDAEKCPSGFAGIEDMIADELFTQYGISLAGMYWRADDAKNVFNIFRYTRDGVRVNLEMPEEDTQPSIIQDLRTVPRKEYEEIDDEEIEAFREAIKYGMRPPPIHIGKKEYQSDLAPLDISKLK